MIISGNEEHLYRLVMNVVSNALKYTPSGGKVNIQLHSIDRQALISVEDTGIGIPSAEYHKIFDRFYRIDQNRSQQTGGTGLGLSIALAIARSYGGDIQVESEIGQGSRFTIKLPMTTMLSRTMY